MDVEIIAIMIPVVAIIFASAILFWHFLLVHLRRRRLLDIFHEQRMTALSKGVDVPPIPDALLQELGPKMAPPGRFLFRGLVWTLLGLAAFFAIRAVEREGALFALIPAALGVAYLVYYWLEGRRTPSPTPELADRNSPLPEPAKP